MSSTNSPQTFNVQLSDPREKTLVSEFAKKYGMEPSFISRAPGRVNLIGEHIDYMGYGVLPMAIEQDVMIAAKTNSSSLLRIANVDQKYKSFECSAGVDSGSIDSSSPQWYHYFLCGYLGIVEHLKQGDGKEASNVGMDLMVCGKVPPSAGLSSSSALVCASALITYKLLSTIDLSKAELAQICCDCERYIGTQGGGMDQAISFLAEKGKAKGIDFDPIRACDVMLPNGYEFVISHCLAEINKAATSDFNQRVVECRLACQCIAKKLNFPWEGLRRLSDLQNKLGKTLEEMIVLVKEHIHLQPYSKEEILGLLGVTEEQLLTTSLSSNTAHLTKFKLYERAQHVFTEAWRVQEFKRISGLTSVNAARLGDLMNESHVSTRDIYECSHADLDLLTDICRKSGALGSRLTGAGWGGCAVSMVPGDSVNSFMKNVSSEFYTPERLKGKEVDQVLFKTSPAAGACVYKC